VRKEEPAELQSTRRSQRRGRRLPRLCIGWSGRGGPTQNQPRHEPHAPARQLVSKPLAHRGV